MLCRIFQKIENFEKRTDKFSKKLKIWKNILTNFPKIENSDKCPDQNFPPKMKISIASPTNIPKI